MRGGAAVLAAMASPPPASLLAAAGVTRTPSAPAIAGGAGGGAGVVATADGKQATSSASGVPASTGTGGGGAAAATPATVSFTATCGSAVGSTVPLPLRVHISAHSAGGEDVMGNRASTLGLPASMPPSETLVARLVLAVKDGVDLFELGAIVGSMKTMLAAAFADGPPGFQPTMIVKVQNPSAAQPRTCVVLSFFFAHFLAFAKLDANLTPMPTSDDAVPPSDRQTLRKFFDLAFSAEAEVGVDMALAQLLKARSMKDWPTDGRVHLGVQVRANTTPHTAQHA